MRSLRTAPLFASIALALSTACSSSKTEEAAGAPTLDAGAPDVALDTTSDGEADAGAPVTVPYDATWGLRFDPATGALSVVRGADVLLRLPADALQLGTRDVPCDDATNYDPMGVIGQNALSPAPGDLAWRAPTSVTLASATAQGLELALAYDAGFAAKASVSLEAGAGFVVRFTPTAQADRVAWMRVRARASADEGFYGLGEQFDHVNSRGQIRAMQIEVSASSETSLNDAHVPVPFVTGTRGWGLFVETRRPAVFQLGTEEADLVDVVVGSGLGAPDGIPIHLFADAHPLDVTRHYYAVTGAPLLPARWALGPWLWRNENADQAQVEADVAKLRELDLAHTAIWIDRPYATAVNTFDWKPSQFPDPDGMFDAITKSGLRWAIWHAPYLTEPGYQTPEDVAAAAPLLAEAQAAGYYPPASGLLANKWGHLLDLTNPAAVSWWQSHLEAYASKPGFGGFKLDYGEDVVPGPASGRNPWKFANGETEQTMHAGYPLAYHATYAAKIPQAGGFLLCRHGTYGDQKQVSVIWPGDLDASFAKRGDVVSGKKQIGGLPASVVAGLSLGPSGFPFFGADTGGYIHSPPHKELFIRWFEQTALSTVMQVGNGASTVAWEPDAATGFDDELLGFYRTYVRLHLRLFPYLWTYAENLAKDGRPIARPLGLAHPELGVHPDDEYLLGDRLLVAPVVEDGARSRSVVFPSGTWTHWFTGEQVTGPVTQMVDAPLGVLPLYLGDGGIVPMLRPTIDAMEPVADPASIDSYATDAGVLWVRVSPGLASTFVLFDGAEIGQEGAGGPITVTTRDGTELHAGVVVELVGRGAAPTAAPTLDGNALPELADVAALAAGPGWVFSQEAGGTLRVRAPAGKHTVAVP